MTVHHDLRPGQRVRATFRDGTSIVGDIKQGEPGSGFHGALCLHVGGVWWPIGPYSFLYNNGVAWEVLSEPRIPRPRGVGAIVRAAAIFGVDGRSDSAEFGPETVWYQDHDGGWTEVNGRWEAAQWEDLIDPVLEYVGWAG